MDFGILYDFFFVSYVLRLTIGILHLYRMAEQQQPARIRTRRLTRLEIETAQRLNSLDEPLHNLADFADEEEEAVDVASDNEAEEAQFEIESEEEEEPQLENVVDVVPGAPYIGADGTEWQRNPVTATDNVRYVPAHLHQVNLDEGQHLDIEADCFTAIFDNEIVDIIVEYTNVEARKHVNNWKAVDRIEILAFIGLLIMAGVDRSSKRNYEEFFGKLRGLPIFKATTSLKRFKHLLRFIRFDNKDTRDERRAQDKLAPIRDVFDRVNRNLNRYYSPGSTITVDEQLVPFRGRCAFKQYIPSKPDKYGIKFFWLCDAETWYPLNGQVYLGIDFILL